MQTGNGQEVEYELKSSTSQYTFEKDTKNFIDEIR